jgi:hypothetical protein
MQKSSWTCPDCHQTLYVTNSARYWCNECQAEKPAVEVDPMGRDWVMIKVQMEYALERATQQGV